MFKPICQTSNKVVGLFSKLMINQKENSYVLFDGVCNLCNSSVSLIIKYDSEGLFKFSPLQSEFSRQILKSEIADDFSGKSIVLIEGNKVFYRSTAALRIARRMDGLWPIFYVFTIIPVSVRDFIYNLIAKYRYKIFGKKASCMVPEKNIETRFM